MKKLPPPPKLKKLATRHTRTRPTAPPAQSRSSTVAAHSHDPETGHLTVTFTNGSTYRYHDVDPAHGVALASTDSKGSYLHKNIIPHHKGEKVA